MGVGLVLALPLLLLVTALVFYPVVQLAIDAFGEPSGIGNFADFFDSSAKTRALWVTFLDSAIIALLSVGFGAVLAWRLVTLDSRLKRALLWVAVLSPFWMGVVVKNYAFAILLARNGPLNDLLTGLGLSGEPVQFLYTQFAVILGMLYTMLPYAVLPLYAAMFAFDRGLLIAAQSLGASHTRAIWTTLVPSLTPAMFASGVIVFVVSLGFYVTPVLLGGLSLPFMATIISQDLFTYYEYTDAAVAGTLLIVAALLSIAVALWLVGRERLQRAMM